MESLEHVLAAIESHTEESTRVVGRAALLVPGLVVGGRYRLIKSVRSGAVATIWQAEDLERHRRVALGFLGRGLAGDGVSAGRFTRDVLAATRLRSPFVARIYGHGALGSVPFVSTEWLDGEDLRQRFERTRRLPLMFVSKMANEGLRALHAAHSLGIVHGDLQPETVFIEKRDGVETIKLVGFGVARTMRALGSALALDSPAYLSPEIVLDEPHIDARADLWSFAALLYRALTGERPYEGDAETIARKIVEGSARPPSEIVRSLPASLDAFMSKALAPDREQRFQTAGELLTAFEDIVREFLARHDTERRECDASRDPSADDVPTWRPPPDPDGVPTWRPPPLPAIPTIAVKRGHFYWAYALAATIVVAMVFAATWYRR